MISEKNSGTRLQCFSEINISVELHSHTAIKRMQCSDAGRQAEITTL